MSVVFDLKVTRTPSFNLFIQIGAVLFHLSWQQFVWQRPKLTLALRQFHSIPNFRELF